MARPRLFLIDSFGFIFRAYHARARTGAPPMRTSSGLPTEAVYIFHNMLRKLTTAYHPEYITAIFESSEPTFRSQAFADYKANRVEMPADLAPQIGYVRKVLEAMRIPTLEYAGFEADDVIGTLARSAVDRGVDVVIVSSDKDMLQLVDDRIRMLNPAKDDLWYDIAKVVEYMGVPPPQVADLLALRGDAIDNIPGAPGIGEKGARDLIQRFGSVEAALEHAAEVERKTYRESLQNNREQVELSKKLATIDTSVPIDWSLEKLAAREPETAALRTLYRELEFYSLLRELGGEETVSRAAVNYQNLDSAEAVEQYLASISDGDELALVLSAAGAGLLDTPAIGLAAKPGEARSVGEDLFPCLAPVFAAAGRPKTAHDAKWLLTRLAARGLELQGLQQDVLLQGFLLTADPAACGLEALAERFLRRKPGASVEEHADCVLELSRQLASEVEARGLGAVYREIDLPLIPVLARMERTGIRVEPAQLERLSGRMDEEIQRLTSRIYELAGRPFNVNSPQQLGKVLFEDLNLPSPVKRGKGKTQSTAADILETLASEHEIARLVLEYRQLAKLKGTYVDALPSLVEGRTGRLHTTFNQAGAATGRLSSSNPNLQNIPIRTELGREIRAAFVPREGWTLVVADYSQIELRLLAHMSRDPVLVDAFRRGEDIHTRTAAEVFGVGPLMVTPELRRAAKAVNFGIVYGQTPFGLAAQLGIPRQEAEKYIQNYFAHYAGVKTFVEAMIAEVGQSGMTRTLFGRQRPIPDIHSRNPNARGFAERTAVNTPLQGTAADLIKIAMIRIDRELESRRLSTRMLLQVHDELLFESPTEELEEVTAMIRREMEQVHALEVPLVVDIGMGSNWRDAK